MAGNTLGTFLPGALAGTFETLLLDRVEMVELSSVTSGGKLEYGTTMESDAVLQVCF